MRDRRVALFRKPETKGRVVIEVADGVYIIVRVLCRDVENLELTATDDVNDTHFGIE